MHKQSKLLIFTDLDGTLLDYHTYSKEAALPALNKLRELDIPLIISSSKTRKEIKPLLDLPYMSQAFIVENGSAVFFRRDLGLDLGEGTTVFGDYEAIILGERYDKILKVLGQAQKECGVKIRGFSDMPATEVAKVTGLDIKSAFQAKDREFSEPFLFEGDPAQLKSIIRALENKGLTCVQGGRFYHVLGDCDKGRALARVVEIYNENCPGIIRKVVALGDSENDVPLFDAADVAVIIKRHDGSFAEYTRNARQEIIKPAGIGPEGWNEAVMDLIQGRICH